MEKSLPLVKLNLPDELTAARAEELADALSETAQEVTGSNAREISVSVDPDAGPQTTAREAMSSAKSVVTAYLQAMERRDLETAADCLGADFVMHFPNAAPMRQLSELLLWAKGRYQSVRKDYLGIDAYASQDGVVVIVQGHLNGEWPDGTPFSGVRFIDRFELSDGKITRQDVWNDLAEVRGAHAG